MSSAAVHGIPCITRNLTSIRKGHYELNQFSDHESRRFVRTSTVVAVIHLAQKDAELASLCSVRWRHVLMTLGMTKLYTRIDQGFYRFTGSWISRLYPAFEAVNWSTRGVNAFKIPVGALEHKPPDLTDVTKATGSL